MAEEGWSARSLPLPGPRRAPGVPGGADAQVYDPADEQLVRLVFKDATTTKQPLIARLAAEEGILCNVISASTQKLSERCTAA